MALTFTQAYGRNKDDGNGRDAALAFQNCARSYCRQPAPEPGTCINIKRSLTVSRVAQQMLSHYSSSLLSTLSEDNSYMVALVSSGAYQISQVLLTMEVYRFF